MPIFLEDFKKKSHQFKLYSKAISVAGPDAQQYLHSQTTNSILNESDFSFSLHSILDTAGKIISSFIICKKNADEFFLLVKEDFIDVTLERLEKYHISEDFEISIVDLHSRVKIHGEKENNCYLGDYFFEEDQICLSDTESVQKEIPQELRIFSGIPELGIDVTQGTLINNTRLDELSVDYSKGCYPGQETVSKIDSRRGAAYKPVLIELSHKADIPLQNASVEGKKIGVVQNTLQYSGKTYIVLSLIREKRIAGLHINFEVEGSDYEGKILLFPYLAHTKKELAIEFYDHAMELFQSGEDEVAIEYFKKSIEFDEGFEDAFESLGVLYGRLNNFEEAIRLMNELRRLNPKCMMALTNLSLYHMKIGDIPTAEDFKSKATLLNFELLGDEAEKKRKLEETKKLKAAEQSRREQMYKQVLEIDPEDAMANNGLGEIEFEKENFEQAIKNFEMALKGDQKYSVAYLGLGKSYLKVNREEDAKEIFERGIAIAAKNGDLMPANEMQSLISKLLES